MESLEEGGTVGPRTPWAILKTGGKQYRVRVGDRLNIARLRHSTSLMTDTRDRRFVTFDDVLVVCVNEKTIVGQPSVPNACVVAELLPERRGPKIIAFKKRRRQNSRRRRGSREILQPIVVVSVEHGRAADVPTGVKDLVDFTAVESDDIPKMLLTLETAGTPQLATLLNRMASLDWAAVPAWIRSQVASAIEPLLTYPEAPLRAPAVLALARLLGWEPSVKTSPMKLAELLMTHFATSRRRYFQEISVREEIPQTAKPGGGVRYQARVSLRDEISIPDLGLSVRLKTVLPASAHVELIVSGQGVNELVKRTVRHRDRPFGVLREEILNFSNDTDTSDYAVLDTVVNGQRVDRRFLSLKPLAITRKPPARVGRGQTYLRHGPNLDAELA